MSRKSLLSLLFVASLASVCALYAQEGGLQQQVGQLKESMAKNKQALAQYTWVETVTISLKGQEKKQQHFQVQMDQTGSPKRPPLDSAPAAQPQQSSGRGGRLRERVVEKKKEEYEDYAEQMKALARAVCTAGQGSDSSRLREREHLDGARTRWREARNSQLCQARRLHDPDNR